MNAIEKFYSRRNFRLKQRGLKGFRLDADEESNNNNNNKGGGKSGGGGYSTRLPYGIAKGMGIDTTGMTPSDVWDALKGKGVSPSAEYRKLRERGKQPKGGTKKSISSGGKDWDNLKITFDSPHGEGPSSISELHLHGQEHGKGYSDRIPEFSHITDKNELLYRLKQAGVTKVSIQDKQFGEYKGINPQEVEFPKVLFETKSSKTPITKVEFADDGKISLIGLSGKSVGGTNEKNISRRKEWFEKYTGESLLDRPEIPDSVKKLAKEVDAIKDQKLKTKWGTYSELSIEKGSSAGTATFSIRGKNEKGEFINVFSSKNPEDMMLHAKELGVKKIYDTENDRVVDLEKDELPRAIGKKEHEYYPSMSISQTKDGLVLKATDFGGASHKMKTAKTIEELYDYASKKLGVEDTGAIKVSSKVSKPASEKSEIKSSESPKSDYPKDSESFSKMVSDFRSRSSTSKTTQEKSSESSLKSALEKLGDLEQQDELSPKEYNQAKDNLVKTLRDMPDGTTITTESGGRSTTGITVYKKENGKFTSKSFSGPVSGTGKFFEHEGTRKTATDELMDGMRDVLEGRFRIQHPASEKTAAPKAKAFGYSTSPKGERTEYSSMSIDKNKDGDYVLKGKNAQGKSVSLYHAKDAERLLGYARDKLHVEDESKIGWTSKAKGGR